MRFIFTKKFRKCCESLPVEIQETIKAKLRLLVQDPRHPSLRVKKMQGAKGIWEASVTMDYRLTFEMAADKLILRTIGKHDETLKNP